MSTLEFLSRLIFHLVVLSGGGGGGGGEGGMVRVLIMTHTSGGVKLK